VALDLQVVEFLNLGGTLRRAAFLLGAMRVLAMLELTVAASNSLLASCHLCL
jgi:hypothetical protein